jgi:uncharacterized protein YukE
VTETMIGLDPKDCLDLVKLLKESAHRLEQSSSQLNQSVARTGWQGPDSQRFRSQWPGQRAQMLQTATALGDLASVVLRNVAEQERASAAEGGGGGLLDKLFDGAHDLWDDLTTGAGHIVNEVESGVGWLMHQGPGAAYATSGQNFLDQLNHLGVMGADILAGKPPSMAGLAAQLILAAGTGFSAGVLGLSSGMLNLNLFDDGSPKVGEPLPVGPGTERNKLTLPTSASTLFQGVVDAYDAGHVDGTKDGDIRILTVKQPDGSNAYIVNIPGTENWGIDGSAQARDLTSNLMLVAGQSTTAQQDIVLAMEKAGIPPGAPVMLNGHSQGGMLAAQLGSDPQFMARFNVTNIMTVGSPIDINAIDPRVHVLAVQHDGDVVPKLDLGGLDVLGRAPAPPANVLVVNMDNPPPNAAQVSEFSAKGAGYGSGVGSVNPGGAGAVVGANWGGDAGEFASGAITNHDFLLYRDDIADTGKYPDIAAYEDSPSVKVFLSSDPSKVSAVDMSAGRQK